MEIQRHLISLKLSLICYENLFCYRNLPFEQFEDNSVITESTSFYGRIMSSPVPYQTSDFCCCREVLFTYRTRRRRRKRRKNRQGTEPQRRFSLVQHTHTTPKMFCYLSLLKIIIFPFPTLEVTDPD